MALLLNGELIADDSIERQRTLLLHSISGARRDIDLLEWEGIQRLAEENAVCRALLHQMASNSGSSISSKDINDELAYRKGTTQTIICGSGEHLQIERDIRLLRFIDQVTRGTKRPVKRELETEYASTVSRFRVPERVHVARVEYDHCENRNGSRNGARSTKESMDVIFIAYPISGIHTVMEIFPRFAQAK